VIGPLLTLLGILPSSSPCSPFSRRERTIWTPKIILALQFKLAGSCLAPLLVAKRQLSTLRSLRALWLIIIGYHFVYGHDRLASLCRSSVQGPYLEVGNMEDEDGTRGGLDGHLPIQMVVRQTF
jgi:hypothetical protein